MAKVGQIFVSLGLETSSFATNLKKARDLAFGSSAEIRRSLEFIGKAFTGASLTGVAAFGALVKSEIDVADHFNDLSKRTGVAVETLSGLKFAAEQSGTNMEALAVGLGKFNKAIFEASQGSKEQAATFRNLGIAVRDSTGRLGGTEQILLKVASRFAAMPDGVMKTALAMQLFGKSGAELIPLLDEGAQGLQGFMEKAREMGLVISGQTAAAADELNDNLNELKGRLTGFTRQLAGPVISALANFKDGMRAISKEGGFAEGGEALFAQLKRAERFAEALRAQANRKISVLTIEDQWAARAIEGAAKLKDSQEAAKKAAEKLHDEVLAAAKNIKMVDFLPPSLLTLAEKTKGAVAAWRALNAVATEMPNLSKDLRDFGAEGREVFESTRLPVEILAKRLNYLNDLVAAGAINMDTYKRAMQQAKEQSGLLAGALQQQTMELVRNLAFVSQTGLTSIGDALLGLSSWRQVFKQITTDLARMIFQLYVVRPLMNAIFGSFFKATSFNVAPSGGGFSPGSFTSFPGFAAGGHFSAGQMMTVGERGTELAVFDRPGTILPHGASAGGVVQNINIDARGAELGTVARLNAMITRQAFREYTIRTADRASRTL